MIREAMITIAVLLLVGTVALPSQNPNILVRFEGGIGVHPVSGYLPVAKTAVPNKVRGVMPFTVPWVIKTLSVEVRTDGYIKGSGTGLVLAAGRGIGTRAGIHKLRVTLFCGIPAVQTQTVTSHSSKAIALSKSGSFTIDEQLANPKPPNPCKSPVLLIRDDNEGAWLAAGIPFEQ